MTGLAGVWERFRRRPAALFAASVVLLIVLATALAPQLSPHHPHAILDPVGLQLQPPHAVHPLGTDELGRDVLSRVLHGGRVSLFVGLAAALLAALLAGVVGFAAGLGGPALDAVLMRSVDVLLALPRFFVVMAVFAFSDGVPLIAIVVILGITGWFELARIVRARVRELRHADFVTAALALGASRVAIARQLLPHVATTLIVGATLDVGNIILLEAGLSFLGLGLAPPAPTWGNMILEGRNLVFGAPWVALAPGIALVITVTAINLAGDGLRDAMDPRSRA